MCPAPPAGAAPLPGDAHHAQGWSDHKSEKGLHNHVEGIVVAKDDVEVSQSAPHLVGQEARLVVHFSVVGTLRVQPPDVLHLADVFRNMSLQIFFKKMSGEKRRRGLWARKREGNTKR